MGGLFFGTQTRIKEIMEEPKWIETKKEYEANEAGNLVVKKVTYEVEKPVVEKKQRLERKDIIDLTLRFVSVLAIGVPIFLFYFQQKAEIRRQRALIQVEAFLKASMLLHELVENEKLEEVDFENKRIKVFHEYTPTIALYSGNDSINKLLIRINDNLKLHLYHRFILKWSDAIAHRHTKEIVKTDVDAIDTLKVLHFDSLQHAFFIGIRAFESGLKERENGSELKVNSNQSKQIIDCIKQTNSALSDSQEQLTLMVKQRKLYGEVTINEKAKWFNLLNDQANTVFDCETKNQQASKNHLIHIQSLIKRLDRLFTKTNRYLSEE